jgi:hypothetical protein
VTSTLKYWRDEYEELIREAESLHRAGQTELAIPLPG